VIPALFAKFAADVRHWVIAALVLVVIVLTIWLQLSRAGLATAKAQNETLTTKISTQNQAVRKWKEEGERAREQALAAQQAAAKVRAESNRRIAELQVEQVPTDCTGAVKWAAGKATVLVEAWQ